MRSALLGLVASALLLASGASAQIRTAEVGVFAGPLVQVDSSFEGSFATGVRLRRANPSSPNGAWLEIGYTYTDAARIDLEADDPERDTIDVRLIEANVGYRAEGRALRFEPGIGFGVTSLGDNLSALFTTAIEVSFTPTPEARVRPWIGVQGKYYGLIPFESDGLYLVALTASLDFTRTGLPRR